MSYTKELYEKEVKPSLQKEFAFKNVMEIPRLVKVCLNTGIKATDNDKNYVKYITDQMSLIAGQQAVVTKARKSIAGFKLREGMPIGCKVTLRGERMYEFLDILIYVALARIRDFRGLSSKNFNQSGHFSFGIKEHSVFPEVDLDAVSKSFGMNVTIVTNVSDKQQNKALLKALYFPINN